MRPRFVMRIRFTVTIKLLLFVLPLVCIPIAIVGYLSYETSVESVTSLSRREEMLQARAAASEINAVLQSCCADLETIDESLKIVGATTPRDQGDEEDSKRLLKLFHNFRSRSPYYVHIGFLEARRREAPLSRPGAVQGQAVLQPVSELLPIPDEEGGKACRVSKIAYSPERGIYVLRFSRELSGGVGESAGTLFMDLDFSKLIGLVNSIKVGSQGFAFLVDESGRIIAHPSFKPYEYDLTKYDDPRFQEFVVDMIAGETGWRTYNYFGEKAAAFAPVPATGWSLAVTIPFDEFKAEARGIRARVLGLVFVVLALSGAGVGALSYQILKPVRRMAAATESMASGDLRQDIPVRSRDELGALAQSFNRMVKSLRETQTELIRSEKLVSMGRLSAGVAHELRNPLNAMKGAVFFIQQQRPGDPLIAEYTQLVLEEIDRLNLFVTEFLYFARQSSPNLVLSDLNKLLSNCLSLNEEEFKRKRIKTAVDLHPALPLLEMDVHQMEQVFLNLLANAVQAMPKGGLLTISTAVEEAGGGGETGARAVVKIRDNGTGIASAHLKSIFDPFFSTKEAGTGLGLPISLGIVESHHGALEISSKENEETTVVIKLPLRSDPSGRGREDEEENPGRR